MHTLLELSRKMGCPTTAKEGATGAQLFRELITYERGKFYSAPPLGGSYNSASRAANHRRMPVAGKG
jgi:hypothetical protein